MPYIKSSDFAYLGSHRATTNLQGQGLINSHWAQRFVFLLFVFVFVFTFAEKDSNFYWNRCSYSGVEVFLSPVALSS